MKTKLIIAAATLITAVTTWAQITPAKLMKDEIYSLITVVPKVENLTTEQKLFIIDLQKDVKNMLQPISDSLVGTLTSTSGIQNIFVELGQQLQTQFEANIDKNSVKLPNDAIILSAYIMPWDSDAKAIKLKTALLGDIQQINIDLNDSKNKSADLFYKMGNKIKGLSLGTDPKTKKLIFIDKEAGSKSHTLRGIALHLKIQKNQSTVRLQILSNLKPGSNPLVVSNDQVNFTNLEILSGTLENRPMVIANIEQQLQVKNAIPSINVQLGTFGGVDGGLNNWSGAFQILSTPWTAKVDCKSRFNTVPALVGTIGGKAAGDNFLAKLFLNKIAKDMPVKFRILNINIDPRTSKISKMNLAMEVSPVSGWQSFPKCYQSENVNAQFMNEANMTIESKIASLYNQDDMTNDLMQNLYM